MFATAADTQVLGKVVNGGVNGFACGVVADVALEQVHVNGVRCVIVQFRSFLQRKMVHLNGVDLQGKNLSVKTGGHALGHGRLAAAGGPCQSNDEDLPLNRSSTHASAFDRGISFPGSEYYRTCGAGKRLGEAIWAIFAHRVPKWHSGNWLRCVVTQISQAHAQVMVQRVRDADRKGKAEQSLGQPKRVNVAIAAEQGAGSDSPQQRGRGQGKIGQVRQREQYSCERDCGRFARKQAQQPRHEVILQKKLLIASPEDIPGDVFEVAFIKRVQRADFFRDDDADNG